MQLQHGEMLHVVTIYEPNNYKQVYTVDTNGEKHGVEYVYYPNSPLYFSISHYIHGDISGPTLYFCPDGSIDHMIDIGTPRIAHPKLDDFITYVAVKEHT